MARMARAACRERKARERAELQLRVQIVIARVEIFRLPLGALSSERRTARFAMVRHLAYHLCHVAGASLPVVSANLSRDHSTLIHGVNLIRRRMDGARHGISHFRSPTGTPHHLCHVRKHRGRRVMRRTPAKDRALSLRERALELVTRQGRIERFGHAGIYRAVRTADFSICYADPETSHAQFHHLDIHSGGRKVMWARWLTGGQPEIRTFRRGPWEAYYYA
jgi:hypothetical protein